MKNLFKTFNVLLACTAMLFMYSCQEEGDSVSQEEQGSVEFILSGYRAGDVKTLEKSGSTTKDGEQDEVVCDMALASYASLEISGLEGVMNFTINLKAWGDSFKTDPIELDPGTYSVISFQLYDEDDNPLYATPMADSEFGAFVSQALPFDFDVENFRKIEYNIEVLCIEDFTPPQFGFAFWDVTIKQIKNLCVFANFCEPDTGHEVASLEAFIYPNENQTSASDLIWSGSADGDFESEDEDNELLCLKFPYDPSIDTGQQSYYVELFINDVLFYGTMPLDRVDLINDDKGYLHLNENCQGDFDVFSNSYNVAWEDLNGDNGANDVDYNDFILETTSFTDITTGDLTFVFEPIARGGGFNHAFKFWLPGTGYVITGASSVDDSSGNTMVEVYPNTRMAAFGLPDSFVNTKCNGTSGTGIAKTITVDISGAPNFSYYLLSPFDANLAVNGNYDLTIGNIFPPSTFNMGSDVLENGLVTPKNWKWVIDGKDIRNTYGPNFTTNFVPNNTGDLYESCP